MVPLNVCIVSMFHSDACESLLVWLPYLTFIHSAFHNSPYFTANMQESHHGPILCPSTCFKLSKTMFQLSAMSMTCVRVFVCLLIIVVRWMGKCVAYARMPCPFVGCLRSVRVRVSE